jgi:H+/Cl- antiporter ClcA
MAFGVIISHLIGAAAGPPALYAVVAMGAVFTADARAPLTSVASVVEMTGDYTLTLPVMLAVAIATATSRAQLRDHLHHQAATPRPGHRPRRALEGFQRPQGGRRHAPVPYPAGRPRRKATRRRRG